MFLPFSVTLIDSSSLSLLLRLPTIQADVGSETSLVMASKPGKGHLRQAQVIIGADNTPYQIRPDFQRVTVY